MNVKMDLISPAEQEWISEQILAAKAFVSEIIGKDAAELPSPEDLDQAFNSWRHSPSHDPAQANTIVNCVGAAFGQHLVNTTSFEWVIATDEYGTELAVYGFPGRGDVLVYPQNFVAKRYESKAEEFIVKSINEIMAQVSGIEDGTYTN